MKLLDKIADAITGNTRQSSDRVVKLAQLALRKPESLTLAEIKSLAGSVLSQAVK